MPAKMKSIEQLKRELAAQQRQFARLKAKRAKLAARLAKVDAQIAATAGGAEVKPRRRRRRKVAKAKRGRPRKVAKAKRGRPRKVAKAKRGRPRKVAKAKRGRPKKVAKAKRGRPKKVAKRAKRRRATGRPLADYIRTVLAGQSKGMRAKDITTAVRKAGYKTYSKDFYGIVATALRDKKKFKNLRRGVYTLA